MTLEPNQEPKSRAPLPDTKAVLTGQRRVLVDALARKSPKSDRAIRMYVAAVQAFDRDDGQETLHIAAYELREFMGALPGIVDLPLIQHPQLRAKAQTFADDWTQRSGRSACKTVNGWSGSIDEHLDVALGIATAFAIWVNRELPSRRDEARVALTKLSVSSRPLPTPLIERRVDEWTKLGRYFNKSTHHNGIPERDEFSRHLNRLEEFLLEHLEPRPFVDQDEIDELIKLAGGQ